MCKVVKKAIDETVGKDITKSIGLHVNTQLITTLGASDFITRCIDADNKLRVNNLERTIIFKGERFTM